jgi:hypothetical protein
MNVERGWRCDTNDSGMIKEMRLSRKPYDTDFTQKMTINKFKNKFVHHPYRYYVFCDYSRNNVTIATE